MTILRKLLSLSLYLAALELDGQRWVARPIRVYDVPANMLPRGL